MPNVINTNFYEALKLLQQAGVYVPPPGYFPPSSISIVWQQAAAPGGSVIAQNPAAGSGVSAGQAVTLTLAAFVFGAVIDTIPNWSQVS